MTQQHRDRHIALAAQIGDELRVERSFELRERILFAQVAAQRVDVGDLQVDQRPPRHLRPGFVAGAVARPSSTSVSTCREKVLAVLTSAPQSVRASHQRS